MKRAPGAVHARPGGYIRPFSSGFAVLQRLVDACAVLGALYLATRLRGTDFGADMLQIGIVAALGFYAVGDARGIYGSWRMKSIGGELRLVLGVWAAAFALVLAVAFFTKTSATFSRVALLLWLTIAPLALMSARLFVRLLLREFRRRGHNTRAVAIAGAGRTAIRLAEELESMPWTGLAYQGCYDDALPGLASAGGTGTLSGSLTELVARAREGEIDVVYIALPLDARDRITGLIDALSDTTACVYLVPDVFALQLDHARWVDLNGIPLVSIHETPFASIGGWVKRLEDIMLSLAILAVAAVPMLAIAAAVKAGSPGPVIFRQRRYGLDGKLVDVWKFRSMTVCEDGGHIAQATREDVRVTAVGRFLRQTSLDELPQFFNVLHGTMSVVGPRPHAVAHNEQYRPLIRGYMLRHKVKPGITGWAQVHGWRGETDTLEKMKKRVEFDLHYIRNWSLVLDLKIVWMTLRVGFRGEHAY